MDRPYILIPEFSLHDQRWLWCPMGSNHRSSIERLRWCCPCLHKQTKLKAMSRPIGLGVPHIELSESRHPSNVGVNLVFHLSHILSSHHITKAYSSFHSIIGMSRTVIHHHPPPVGSEQHQQISNLERAGDWEKSFESLLFYHTIKCSAHMIQNLGSWIHNARDGW